MANRVLLIGWDAADWQLIHPLLDAGEMPNLARLVEGGCIGNLATLYPCLSPLLWTTVATGQTADRHRILSFLEPLPSGTGAQLARSTSRQCKAIWNIASQSGLRSVVCNWYASHPAEPILGGSISNEAFKSPTSADFSAWQLPADSIQPPDWRESLSGLRVHPSVGARYQVNA
jgi:predicted AlkP superfamily phosphohydrolase/phosphomutase